MREYLEVVEINLEQKILLKPLEGSLKRLKLII